MGIFIHLAVSTSVTPKEWEVVYKETLQLVKAFPLAERLEVPVRGIPTWCLVPTEEREAHMGWIRERVETGWMADGDYDYLRTAETYFLPRDLTTDDQYEEDAPDAMLVSVPSVLREYKWNDSRFQRCYSLWGDKTQGEPYHMYLLAIACLIESRLGRKAYVYGDITKGQCERAVRMANEHLDQPIHTPDRCDVARLLARIEDLPFTETEKLQLLTNLYLGRKDAEFGTHIRNHFSAQACDEYWRERFQSYQITMRGFDYILEDYLLWGFDLEKMCSFVRFEDDDGNTHYEDFIKRIMDAKLHHRNKDCSDMLKIDPDEEEPYGIDALFAQFTLGGARNKKIDRYIPLEEVKLSLLHASGSLCPVNELIEAYLQEERAQEPANLSADMSVEEIKEAIARDPYHVLTETLKSSEQILREAREEYAIFDSDDLPYYEAGNTMRPQLMDAVGKSIAFYRSALCENTYLELMKKTPEKRCQWLARTNQRVLLRDKDWQKIYDDIMDNPESFARYYPMVRVKITSEGVHSMVRAFVVNDALYSYALELQASTEEP